MGVSSVVECWNHMHKITVSNPGKINYISFYAASMLLSHITQRISNS
jgi:hypothetical protein